MKHPTQARWAAFRSWLVLVLGALAAPRALGLDPQSPWITSRQPITILSANDGGSHLRLDERMQRDSQRVTRDSITVIHLGPDHPPLVRTVFDAAPNTISGVPYLAMTPDGHYGFVTSRPARASTGAPEVISVIDLSREEPAVVQTVEAPSPTMAAMHPDGRHLLVPCAGGVRVYEFEEGRLRLLGQNQLDISPTSIDISPHGEWIVANGRFQGQAQGAHRLRYREGIVEYVNELGIRPGLGQWHGPFAARFSPDGRRVLLPNGRHVGGKGTLDDLFIADMTLDPPLVTEAVRQVADGIEGVAFHPSGRMAVLSCLEEDRIQVHGAYSHLAVVDLASQPARLLYHLDVEPVPEGMEFSPDGSQLFVGLTSAHRIAVFDVRGYLLERSRFVIRVGHAPAAMAVGPRYRPEKP